MAMDGIFLFFVLFLFFCFDFVFSSKFENCTPWRNDQNLIVPVLRERKKERKILFCAYRLIFMVTSLTICNRFSFNILMNVNE